VTPVEIADHATAAIAGLEVEVLDMLMASDEFGWMFDKLDGWRCTVGFSNSECGWLEAAWSRYAHGCRVTLALHVRFPAWAHIETCDHVGIESWVMCGTEMRWPDIAAAVDAALAEFEKLKEGTNV
jgi:hypothetical protein